MRIVVTTNGKKGKAKTFTIEVLDEEKIIYKESAPDVKKRDEIVWRLAELYNILEIDVKEGSEEFKFAEIPNIPVLEEDEADEFFEDNRDFVYERILQAVEEGIKSKRDSIRLFELNGSGVYITSQKEDWKTGVEQALDYYVSVEEYTKCVRARQILSAL